MIIVNISCLFGKDDLDSLTDSLTYSLTYTFDTFGTLDTFGTFHTFGTFDGFCFLLPTMWTM